MNPSRIWGPGVEGQGPDKFDSHKLHSDDSNVEALAQACSVKKALLEISQDSQENTNAKASILIKLQAWELQLY